MKKKVFIGSSTEIVEVAYAIQQNLDQDFECTVWNQGIFSLSTTTMDSLLLALNNTDLAIFVFNPDDLAVIKGKDTQITRDNVIFELGLFIGKLGKENNFIVVPSGKELHIPTDLLGLTIAYYSSNRSDHNLQAATAPACSQIRNVAKQKTLTGYGNDIKETIDEKEQIDETIEDSNKGWIKPFVEKKYIDAITKIDKLIEKERDKSEKYDLELWKQFIEFKVNPVDSNKYFTKEIKKRKSPILFHRYALSFYFNHDYINALKIIEQAKKRRITSESLIQLEADCIMKSKLLDDVILYFSDILKAHQTNIELTIKYGKYLIQNTKLTEAKNLYISYLRNTKNEKILYEFARLYDDTNDNELIAYIYSELSQLDSKNPTYYGYLGNAFLKLNLNNEAYLAYIKSKEIDDNQSWIESNIGNLLNNNSFYSLAKNYTERALQLDKDSVYAQKRLSSILESIEKEQQKKVESINKGQQLYIALLRNQD